MNGLWHPNRINTASAAIFNSIPSTGESWFAKCGHTVIITKNKAKSIVDCPVWIPRSAFRNTIRHNKTTTPTILFSFPNKILKIVTNKKQNAIVTAIFTKYTSI
jgi:hypothetical protein